jgi:hypothetical protein
MSWIKEIKGVFKKAKPVLPLEAPRFLFQQDFYSIAWELKHQGYYINPEGIKYSYDNPANWNFYEKPNNDGKYERSWGIEKISFIEKNNLLKNLNSCDIRFTKNKIESDRILSLIDELTYSDLIEANMRGCDMGLHSSSLLVFDDLNNKYKRILLDCQGDRFLELNSDKKAMIYELFKQTTYKSAQAP